MCEHFFDGHQIKLLVLMKTTPLLYFYRQKSLQASYTFAPSAGTTVPLNLQPLKPEYGGSHASLSQHTASLRLRCAHGLCARTPTHCRAGMVGPHMSVGRTPHDLHSKSSASTTTTPNCMMLQYAHGGKERDSGMCSYKCLSIVLGLALLLSAIIICILLGACELVSS